VNASLATPCPRSVDFGGQNSVKGTLGILFLLCSIAGCGGGSNSSPTGISLAGNWLFTAHSQASGETFTGSAPLQQNGTSISGTIKLSGSPCATSATLSGSISGTAVTFQVELGDQPVNFSGTSNSGGTSMSGSYTAPSGGCTNGDFGMWSATKVT
jgi:hypothetical protein